jgi:hypothetical protein
MPNPRRRDPVKERYWRRWLRLWRRSGLSVRAFCAQHGLPESGFYAWRRELARRQLETRTPQATATTRSPAKRSRASAARCRRLPGAGSGGRSTVTTQPTFIQVALPTAIPSLDLVLAQGRVLRVQPGFDADLLRQLLRALEEPPC